MANNTMPDVKRSFVAYSSQPPVIGETITVGVDRFNSKSQKNAFETWEENDISGRPLTDPVFEKIRVGDCLVADISVLNFNVVFEIGFAIGCGKRVILTKNRSIKSDDKLIQRVGIFDTLGYSQYENGVEFAERLAAISDVVPLKTTYPLNRKSPVYILQTPHRTEATTRIISRVKKTRLLFRSFDPSEKPRMAAVETIAEVSSSFGVVVPLLTEEMVEAGIHNLRAAFVAGLAHGLDKETIILSGDSGNEPLDVRDFVKHYRHPDDIKELIGKFSLNVYSALQEKEDLEILPGTLLEDLDLGSSTAENEFQTLSEYYLQTDEYRRTIRGDVNLVIGRKGSGKTALFSQVRNDLRRDRQKIVVDLKPEGYQLLKFKSKVLDYLDKGARLHLITAFWEYVLYLEICYKLLEKDEEVHLRNHQLTQPYSALSEAYAADEYIREGDFSERLLKLADEISQTFQSTYGTETNRNLDGGEITQLLYKHNLKELRRNISDYLKFKMGVWVLFDNVDKGWATSGVTSEDLVIIRSLIDASRKIEREMQRDGHEFHSVVFIRNDVYQLLVRETADRGKDIRVTLDWSDPEMLRELIRRRLIYNNLSKDSDFEELWRQIFNLQVDGEESSQYLIDKSLMRPRYLLNLINHCRACAVNFGHKKITEDDVTRGLIPYSQDLVVDTDYELQDVCPEAAGVIYSFIDSRGTLYDSDLRKTIIEFGVPVESEQQVVDFLMWFGFLGICRDDDEPVYIHSVGYDFKKLEIILKKSGDDPKYRINSAFWAGLAIEDMEGRQPILI